MEKIAENSLFLVEYIVDSVQMNTSESDPGMCVSFQFFDHPPTYVPASLFLSKNYENLTEMDIGQPYSFSLTAEEIYLAICNFKVTVKVIRKERECLGEAIVSLSEALNEIIKTVYSTNAKTVVRSVKNTFSLLNPKGNITGSVSLCIHVSCLDKEYVENEAMKRKVQNKRKDTNLGELDCMIDEATDTCRNICNLLNNRMRNDPQNAYKTQSFQRIHKLQQEHEDTIKKLRQLRINIEKEKVDELKRKQAYERVQEMKRKSGFFNRGFGDERQPKIISPSKTPYALLAKTNPKNNPLQTPILPNYYCPRTTPANNPGRVPFYTQNPPPANMQRPPSPSRFEATRRASCCKSSRPTSPNPSMLPKSRDVPKGRNVCPVSPEKTAPIPRTPSPSKIRNATSPSPERNSCGRCCSPKTTSRPSSPSKVRNCTSPSPERNSCERCCSPKMTSRPSSPFKVRNGTSPSPEKNSCGGCCSPKSKSRPLSPSKVRNAPSASPARKASPTNKCCSGKNVPSRPSSPNKCCQRNLSPTCTQRKSTSISPRRSSQNCPRNPSPTSIRSRNNDVSSRGRSRGYRKCSVSPERSIPAERMRSGLDVTDTCPGDRCMEDNQTEDRCPCSAPKTAAERSTSSRSTSPKGPRKEFDEIQGAMNGNYFTITIHKDGDGTKKYVYKPLSAPQPIRLEPPCVTKGARPQTGEDGDGDRRNFKLSLGAKVEGKGPEKPNVDISLSIPPEIIPPFTEDHGSQFEEADAKQSGPPCNALIPGERGKKRRRPEGWEGSWSGDLSDGDGVDGHGRHGRHGRGGHHGSGKGGGRHHRGGDGEGSWDSDYSGSDGEGRGGRHHRKGGRGGDGSGSDFGSYDSDDNDGMGGRRGGKHGGKGGKKGRKGSGKGKGGGKGRGKDGKNADSEAGLSYGGSGAYGGMSSFSGGRSGSRAGVSDASCCGVCPTPDPRTCMSRASCCSSWSRPVCYDYSTCCYGASYRYCPASNTCTTKKVVAFSNCPC